MTSSPLLFCSASCQRKQKHQERSYWTQQLGITQQISNLKRHKCPGTVYFSASRIDGKQMIDWLLHRTKQLSLLGSQQVQSMHAFCKNNNKKIEKVLPNSHLHLYKEVMLLWLKWSEFDKLSNSCKGEKILQSVTLTIETCVYLGWLYFYTYLLTIKGSALM